jgi:hypothetical protein
MTSKYELKQLIEQLTNEVNELRREVQDLKFQVLYTQTPPLKMEWTYGAGKEHSLKPIVICDTKTISNHDGPVSCNYTTKLPEGTCITYT